jgi:hypothetical protein
VRCSWCKGPDGIACGPKVAVCQTCRDEADPELAATRKAMAAKAKEVQP